MFNWLSNRPKESASMSLKAAFARSRESGNIDVVLPALRGSHLFVIVGELKPAGEHPEFFLTPSPQPGRMCVTVSESESHLADVQWPKQPISGASLLSILPPSIEIVVIYGDGGDYLTREQLAWFREGK